MDLFRAVETFAYGFGAVRSIHYPYLVRPVGSAFILEDAPRTKPEYRKSELIAANPDPAEVVDIIRAERESKPEHRVCISAIYSDEQEGQDAVAIFKALGFRLTAREGFFGIENLIPPGNFEIRKVESLAEIAAFKQASGWKVMTPEDLESPKPTFRGFLAWQEDEIIGMVRSVHALERRTWCSGLYVKPEHRGKGIARSLMSAMIADDHEQGYQENVLSASKLGGPVYGALGYTRLGTLFFLVPSRK